MITEGISALSADMVAVATLGFSMIVIAAFAVGAYLFRMGRKDDLPYLAALATMGAFGAWNSYAQYQLLHAMSPGVQTGPIYEAVFIIIFLCVSVAFVLGMIVSPTAKSR